MALAKATTKYVRVSHRKARFAADLIRGKAIGEAFMQLTHSNLKAGRLLKKTLESAVANAENNAGGDRTNLYVSEVRVDKGASYKRSWSRSRGRRALIERRTTHFHVAVDSNANREKKK
jgi:large subunit ribosomal protein L22